jgi:hypothetical protein
MNGTRMIRTLELQRKGKRPTAVQNKMVQPGTRRPQENRE